ncbi:6-phosphofructokinase [Clostridium sp. D46t1_190503_E9]|uniref:6-phosphofructokinase n=1 Tax=Clostridium sp. D46t1_190503_E9 TaxID=2787137 RepID=UPI0018981FD4|nr:6-phosphofructokinase [Clostridium sp. D46t1_190503_E9]
MANCIIAQSGGPTSVINSSVVGLLQANKDLGSFDKVYAGLNGIEGILKGNIIELSSFTDDEINTFRYTPSSGLGSCRYKMKSLEESSEEYDKLLDILKVNDIKAFFYVGGNDSMDTIAKLGKYARKTGIDIKFIGIPKTIDNDLMYTDHTPGFGSAAKFIATTALETYLDSSVYINNGIFILETMGRDTGWLAASSCAARINGEPVADFIYLPEVAFDIEKFLLDVRKRFEEKNKVFIVVSEGIRNAEGKFITEVEKQAHDKFGHAQLGGVGSYLKNLIIHSGITSRVKSLELGVLQRCAIHCSSDIDLNEAFEAGYSALKFALEGNSGYMVAIKRESNAPYSTSHFLVEADKIANNVKYFPKNLINDEGNHIKEEALDYFLPLIAGIPSLVIDNHLPKFKTISK